jgi:hypothetical protein
MIIHVVIHMVIWLCMWLYGYICGYICGYMVICYRTGHKGLRGEWGGVGGAVGGGPAERGGWGIMWASHFYHVDVMSVSRGCHVGFACLARGYHMYITWLSRV